MRRRDWLILLVLILPALVLALPFGERRAHAVHGNDGFLNFVHLMSLLTDGDLDFADDAEAFDSLGRGYPFRLSDTPLHEETGRMVNRYGWGSALLWAPLVVPLHFLSGGGDPAGLGPWHFLGVRLGTVLWGALGLVALLSVTRRHFPEEGECPALLAGLALLAATNLGFYLYLHPSMSTGPAFALACFALLQIDRIAVDRRPHRLFWLGFTLALLAATRYGDLAFIVGLAPAILAANAAGKRAGAARSHTPLLIPGLLAGAAPVIAVQMLVWNALYGSPLAGPAPYLGDEYGFAFPGRWAWQVLFSPNHGWLLWHPMLALGLIGLVLLARDGETPLWLRLVPIAVVLQWLFVAMWPVWHGGASFGGRLMATALPVVFFGLHEVARRSGKLFPALLALLILWNALLVLEYGLELIPRQGPVSLGDILQAAPKLLGGG